MELCKPKEEVLEKIKKDFEDKVNKYEKQLTVINELIEEIDRENKKSEKNDKNKSLFINFLKLSVQIKKLEVSTYEKEFIESCFKDFLEKLDFGKVSQEKIKTEIEKYKKKIEGLYKISNDKLNNEKNVNKIVVGEIRSKLKDKLEREQEKLETFENNRIRCFNKIESYSSIGNSYGYKYDYLIRGNESKNKNSFSVSFIFYGMRLIACVRIEEIESEKKSNITKDNVNNNDSKNNENNKNNGNNFNIDDLFNCWVHNIFVSTDCYKDFSTDYRKKYIMKKIAGISKCFEVDGYNCEVEIIPSIDYMSEIHEKVFEQIVNKIKKDKLNELNQSLVDKFREELNKFTFDDCIKLLESLRKICPESFYFTSESGKYLFYKDYLEKIKTGKVLGEKLKRKWYSKSLWKKWIENEKSKVDIRSENVRKKPFLWYVKNWRKMRKTDKEKCMDYKYFEDGLKKYETAERVRYVSIKEYFKKLMDAFDDVWNVVEKIWNESDMKEKYV